jgi:hypothetical protein
MISIFMAFHRLYSINPAAFTGSGARDAVSQPQQKGVEWISV